MSDAHSQVTQFHSSARETASVVQILTEAFKQFVLDVQNYARMSALSLTNLLTKPARFLADKF
ncbi:MAG: hypothetical protein WBQ59_03810 [Candidatus Acidiferrum sp.]